MQQKSFFSRLNTQSGAHMLELVIVLPIFILLLFGVFDFARMISGRSAVRSAASLGARYSAAENRKEWSSISALFGASQSLNTAIDFSTLNSLAAGSGIGSWYNCMYGSAGLDCDHTDRHPAGLSRIYLVEAQAIAYANTTLARNVGSENYPCQASNFTPPRAGCFRCFTLRGNTVSFEPYFARPVGSPNALGKTLGIRCEYDVPIMSTSVAFGWLPEHVTVRGDAFVSVNYLSDEKYSNAR